jgi:hypothetical protein
MVSNFTADMNITLTTRHSTSSQRRHQAISSLETQRAVKRAADNALSYADTIRNDDQTWDSRTNDSCLEHLDKVFSFDEVIVNSMAYRRAFNSYVSLANRSPQRSTEAISKGMLRVLHNPTSSFFLSLLDASNMRPCCAKMSREWNSKALRIGILVSKLTLSL